MNKKLLIVTIIIFSYSFNLLLKGEEMPAYKLFTKDGEASNFGNLLSEALKNDIVFFGELHNNPICHWLQLELAKGMYKNIGKRLIIGAEMFESDDQLKIDEYFSGLINQSNFEKETKLWNNYKTDYKPFLEFAKDSGLKYIATNIPRRYASSVSRKGIAILDTITKDGQKYIAPIPIEVDLELPGYKKMKEEMKGSHGADYISEAQAVKDATMAHFIIKNFIKGMIFLHINGTYHTNNYEGIVWYIKRKSPSLKVMTIATVEQNEIKLLEEKNMNLADFILVIPTNMTKTY